jgi:protoporphyrin/coproporphyrin ferrochelatase
LNGILLMAYGSPDKEEEIEAYYTHIRGGRKPTPGELENLRSRYKMIGGKSPLREITDSTAKKLEYELEKQGRNVRVYVGMKHWHPYISETFNQILQEGITDLTAVALAPHYSKMSIGSYQDAVRKANEERGNNIRVSYVNDWYLNPKFLANWEKRIIDAVAAKFGEIDRTGIFFLFTAHSLPERIKSWNDPYQEQLLHTMYALADNLRLLPRQYGFAFQSAGHSLEPWLGPDILDKLSDLRRVGWKNVLVAAIGFVSDHLEILFDLDIEARDCAVKNGMHLERTNSFNDSQAFIEILASLV